MHNPNGWDAAEDQSGLAFAVDDAAFGEVVGGEFDSYFVARYDPNEVFAHAASHMGEDFRTRFQLNTESRVRQRLGYGPVDFECFFF